MLRPSDSPMKVGVIGTGHVGAITCLSLASVGHRVVGCDADSEKVNALANGRVPFHEPGAQDLLQEQLAGDRLTFTPEIAAAVSHAEVVFICVGTPPRVSGEANLLAVERAGRDIAGAATGPLVIVEKSTVPAGTADGSRRRWESVRIWREVWKWSPTRSSFGRGRLSTTRSTPTGSWWEPRRPTRSP